MLVAIRTFVQAKSFKSLKNLLLKEISINILKITKCTCNLQFFYSSRIELIEFSVQPQTYNDFNNSKFMFFQFTIS